MEYINQTNKITQKFYTDGLRKNIQRTKVIKKTNIKSSKYIKINLRKKLYIYTIKSG